MPELPEVETVRQGLVAHLLNRTIVQAEVYRDYCVRRHEGGPDAFVGAVVGRRVTAVARRGKYLWMPLDDVGPGAGLQPVRSAPPLPTVRPPQVALLAHLGMSGQFRVSQPGQGVPGNGGAANGGPSGEFRGGAAPGGHTRVRFWLDDGAVLNFVDQRTFGHLSVQDLLPTPDGGAGGLGTTEATVPAPVQGIARDLLDPAVDLDAVVDRIRSRSTGIKRALLDQSIVSGIGNIYADEALWRAKVHYARRTSVMRRADARRVLESAAAVMTEALAAGGTSFDALYVNVNGESGYFSRALAVYGRAGLPCPRCETPVRRDAFMNRSSFYCPRCQRKR